MFDREKEIEEIKQIDPEDVLADLKIRYKRMHGYYICHIPWKEDREPSMSIFRNHMKIWKWKDHTSGESGTWIDLYMKVMNYSYTEAIQYLRDRFRIKEEREERKEINTNKEEWKIRDIEEKLIQNKRIVEFLEKERKIKDIPAWLKEIHYIKTNIITGETKRLYGFGISDIAGNYHVRMASHQIKEFVIRRNTIGSTYTIIRKNFNSIVVVEGFIDGIRADAIWKKSDLLILNGVANVEKALETIAKYDNVLVATDNDTAGEEAYQKIKSYCQSQNLFRLKLDKDIKDLDEAVKKGTGFKIEKVINNTFNIQI